MARFVIDPPTLLALLDAGRRVDPEHQLIAPNSIRTEALQILLHDVRRGQRTDETALEAHEQMTAIKLRLLGDRVSRRTAWRLARDHDLASLREAEYVAIAKLQADALVTVDPTMAALADGVVPLAPLEDLLAE